MSLPNFDLGLKIPGLPNLQLGLPTLTFTPPDLQPIHDWNWVLYLVSFNILPMLLNLIRAVLSRGKNRGEKSPPEKPRSEVEGRTSEGVGPESLSVESKVAGVAHRPHSDRGSDHMRIIHIVR